MVKKHLKKNINNNDYNIAYDNLSNKRIIKYVLYQYRKILDYDTLKSCGLHALWRCLQYHDDKYKRKFTSSLYQFVKWECEREIKSKYKSSKNTINIDCDIIADEKSNLFTYISNILDKESFNLIKLRFIDGMTLDEIGKECGFTKESARQKINRILLHLRKRVYKDVGYGIKNISV
jgi:DNA-directed RNA polymerase specialized sigma subunit